MVCSSGWQKNTDLLMYVHGSRVKNSKKNSIYNTYCLGWGQYNEENKRKIKEIKLNIYYFSLTFANILLA